MRSALKNAQKAQTNGPIPSFLRFLCLFAATYDDVEYKPGRFAIQGRNPGRACFLPGGGVTQSETRSCRGEANALANRWCNPDSSRTFVICCLARRQPRFW